MRRYWPLLLLIPVLGWLFCLPRDLFKATPYSTVVQDRSGELLGARTASDGQWRFPPCDSVPSRYAAAVILFEDRAFRYHPGVNPHALWRALRDNMKAGHVTSGGSTITMQVIRLSRGNRPRNLWQKAVEAVLATRLEARCSKDEILALYASHAPFGGNVVGLEAASWRYFGRSPGELSWAESATLAVLPNAPSSIHPGKQREQLLAKRNRLLERLSAKGYLDASACELACSEPLPEAPLPLPSLASHLVARMAMEHPGQRLRTTLDISLQRQLEGLCDRWSDRLSKDGVNDLSALVIDNASGLVLARVGNASAYRERPGVSVDIASSPRSTGSILKPFLYCGALQDGIILPRTLLPDVPVNINGFSPQNFDQRFYGAVAADESLSRSLNVPAVQLLRRYGVPRFHGLLKEMGIDSFTHDASYYGLALILGGGEASLDKVCAAYSLLVRTYIGLESCPLSDRVAVWYTLEALRKVNRPDELDIRLIPSLREAAWKTGTSYGFRDAWAVGMTPDYTIGVWAGNAQGQGVPALTGARTSGPVLFDILNLLPASSSWFPEPSGEGVFASVCSSSGMLASPECEPCETIRIPTRGLESDPCPYHSEGSFLLPPAMEWYYRPHHPEYVGRSKREASAMEFIYPENGSVIYLPRQLDGSVEGAVFHLAHRGVSRVWWHMDGEYLGETAEIHQLRLAPSPGRHILTVVDEQGRSLSVSFRVGE